MNSNKIVEITDKPIDVGSLITTMKNPGAGALSIFLGTTRDNFEGKKVLNLYYEAHPSMAIKQLQIIADYCIKTYNLLGIAIIHRVGEVPITEESIVIVSVSDHRKDGIESTSYCIDQVKRVVPIWKKEIYENGSYNWKENCNCVHFDKNEKEHKGGVEAGCSNELK